VRNGRIRRRRHIMLFNANNVLDLLVEALREGGEVRLREFAKTYASENLAYVEINESSLSEVIDEVLAALNNFDKAAALAVIEGAPERLRAVEEEDDEDDEDEDNGEEDSEEESGLASRVTALETEVARLKEIASRYV
jgi:hypothetical protein